MTVRGAVFLVKAMMESTVVALCSITGTQIDQSQEIYLNLNKLTMKGPLLTFL